MAYEKQVWRPYDTAKSEQENIVNGGVGTAERMNHMEDGIDGIDSNLTSHKVDKTNPHDVTASDVGLGNVKNYGIATNAEATSGTATNKYMTPFLVSEAVKSIKSNVGNAQLNKVTGDTGLALLQVADSETILERITKSGPGLKTGTASSKVSDNPTTTNMIMFVSNMVTTSGGYVIGVNTAGMSWTRTISASKWSGGWKRLVDSTQAQLTKITQDDGQAKLVVAGSNTLLGDFIAKGAGFYTFVTGSATDAPELPLRGYVDMSRPGIGNVYASSDSGKVYHRFVENGKWKGDWQEMIARAEFDALAQRVAVLENGE